jgi:O-antigen/teichoic acid export membrane protein
MEGEERTGELADLIALSLFVSIAVVLPILGGSILIGEQLLGAVYTTEYASAWLVLVIALVGRLFHAVHRIGRNVLLALNQPDITFRVGIISVVANIILNFILVSQFGLLGAATATALSVLVGALPFFYYIQQATVGEIFPTRSIVESVLATGVMMVVVFGVTTTGITTEVGRAIGVFPNVVAVAAAVGTGGVVYGLTMLAINDQTSDGTRRVFTWIREY